MKAILPLNGSKITKWWPSLASSKRLLLTKRRNAILMKLGDKIRTASSSVKLLGVQIDDQLNFNLHISNICRSAANQLNALIRLKLFLDFEEKKTLIHSYFYSNFNYCPLVWMFSSARLLNNVEFLQKRVLLFLYDNHDLLYGLP